MGWEAHAHECKPLQRLGDNVPSNFCRFLARIIMKLKDGGDKIGEKVTENRSRRFKDLMNHYTDIKDNPERQKDISELMVELENFIGKRNMPDRTDFTGIYGRVLVNQFSLLDASLTIIGTGLYLGASVLDHACKPNAYPSFDGRKLNIISLVDWPVLDMSKVFISYVDPILPRNLRRQHLHHLWFFWCDCWVCNDDQREEIVNSMKCAEVHCQAPVPVPEEGKKKGEEEEEEEEIRCPTCDMPQDPEDVKVFREVKRISQYELMKFTQEGPGIDNSGESLKRAQQILEKQGDILHPLNAVRIRTLDIAFNAAFKGGAFLLAMEYGEQNKEGMRFAYGKDHPSYGLFLLKLGKTNIFHCNYKPGLEHLEEAEPILTTAFGEKHPLVAGELQKISKMASYDLDIAIERRLKEKEEREHSLICKACGRKKQIPKEEKKEEPEKLEFNQRYLDFASAVA
ncbi:histone-lysine N-methyltransferase SMYD3-like isoform X2 [Oratosquilla oratoria]